ncbi:UNVERIFIED_CONTAM: hypothetical protein FKN15_075539 [Acipenser sinensis]
MKFAALRDGQFSLQREHVFYGHSSNQVSTELQYSLVKELFRSMEVPYCVLELDQRGAQRGKVAGTAGDAGS